MAAVLLTMHRLGSLKRVDATLARYRAAWIIGITGIAVAGVTVHFWNSLFGLFMFLLGTGAWMIDAPQRVRRERSAPRATTALRAAPVRS